MSKQNSFFIFTKSNYQLIIIGILLIAIGFLLMTGYDANTRPNGKFDENYWNKDIFSLRRIRISPFLVILGFVVEIFAIFHKKKNKIN